MPYELDNRNWKKLAYFNVINTQYNIMKKKECFLFWGEGEGGKGGGGGFDTYYKKIKKGP